MAALLVATSSPPQPENRDGGDSKSPPSRVFELLTDIIPVEILPKLPVKSLIRFKSVSKSFQTLISSSEFIRRHFLTTDNRLLIIPANHNTLCSFDLDSLSSAPPATFNFQIGSNCIVGSCNGLLLIDRNPLVILNPSTRSYLNLPSFSDDSSNLSRRNIGFGFDHVNDDYKIVVVSDYDPGFNNLEKKRVTSVYSVNSKSWKIADQRFPPDSVEERLSGVLINNRLLHWRFWNIPKQKRRIGCFDVCSEEWKDDVMLPDYYYDPTHMNYFLDFGVLENQLSCSFENLVENSFDLWVMKEYGVQESWIKLVSVPISKELNGGIVPVACGGVDSSQVLILQRFNSKMFWYNRVDDTINDVDVPDSMGIQPYICKASLVGVPGGKVFGAVYAE